jgi:serine protease Do
MRIMTPIRKEPMRTSTKLISVAALVSASIVFGMIIAGSLDLTRWASAQKPAASPAASSAALAGRAAPGVGLPSFADMVERISPAVVSVIATDVVKVNRQRRPFHQFDDGSPFDFFFPPDHPRPKSGDEGDDERKEMSGGTGFVIEPDGYILTNNHVVESATKIQVKVNGRDDYDAKIIGRDPSTDLALLKIEGKAPFATIPLGDSDRLRVGDWVMAIGDPLNFEKTVTVGVVSGKGRYAGLSEATRSFESLIQTDAAINFGNSGGPLMNVAGEVIGINTAISRFAQNIGFAIPVNVARRLLPQLKQGKVVRGFLGVTIRTVDKTLQDAYGLKTAEGAIVESVEAGKPGDKAGLKHEDIIVKVDDAAVKTNRDLIDYVSGKAPGSKVSITFLRDGKEKTAVAMLGTRTEEGMKPGSEESRVEGRKEKTLGLEIESLTPALRRQYRIGSDTTRGVLITHVKPVSPAADAGLIEGDVILETNGVAVASVEELQTELKKAPKERWVRFYVLRSIPRAQKFIAAVKPE